MIPRYVPLVRRKPLRSRPVSELGRPDRLTRETVHERDEAVPVRVHNRGLVWLSNDGGLAEADAAALPRMVRRS
jgi:hypothetical protein